VPPQGELATDNANPQWAGAASPTWRNSAPAPDLPRAILGEDMPALFATTGQGDFTPDDHAFGPGAGHGLDTFAGIDDAAPWHATDLGDGATRRWSAAVSRDGTPHLDIIPDEVGADSPATTMRQRTGYGMPDDPAARRASRIARWYDRWIDMHRWDTEYRPQTQMAARLQVATHVPAYDQTVPSTPSVIDYNPRTPDRFMLPFLRRAPGEWLESAVIDGSGQPPQAMTVWGL